MATYLKCLSRARPWAKSFTCNISFSFHSDSVRQVLFPSLFLQMENVRFREVEQYA